MWHALRSIFQRVWRAGMPVVVRAIRKGFDWEPGTMGRATREKNSSKAHEGQLDNEIDVRPSVFSLQLVPCVHAEHCFCSTLQEDGTLREFAYLAGHSIPWCRG